MEKLFSVEDKTGLYWGKACSYMIHVCLYLYIQTKMFAWLMITFAVMTNAVKFCLSIRDTIFTPYKYMFKYYV